jgi:hypothetical protein
MNYSINKFNYVLKKQFLGLLFLMIAFIAKSIPNVSVTWHQDNLVLKPWNTAPVNTGGILLKLPLLLLTLTHLQDQLLN